MKKFRLIIGALVMSILALIASVPSQAAPRTIALPQMQNEVIETFDLQEPASGIDCPALIFRDINDYTFESVGDVAKHTGYEAGLTGRFDLLYFPAVTFQETISQITGARSALNRPLSKRRGFRFTNGQPANSVFANRKNKSSPINQ